MTQILLIAASLCSVSPLNVRKTQDEAANTQLRADIVARGVLQNLIGVPVPRKKGRYEITAGGRRLTQVHAAIAAGELPGDFAVPVLVMADKGDAREASLAENFQRLGMTPCDEAVAFLHCVERDGQTPAEVARRFGLTERFVLGRMRLASLADVVFAALRDGEISLDIATAYAATSDTARQQAVYEQLERQGYGINAYTVRRMVQESGCRGTDPRARLVGRDAYLAAGGRIDADLFDEDAEETWLDTDILDRLAGERLTSFAGETRETHGFAEVRVVIDQGDIWSETRGMTPVRGEPREPTDEDPARADAIADELEAIEEAAQANDGFTDEQDARFDALVEERDGLIDPAPVLTADHKASAIGYVYLSRDGSLQLHREIYTAPTSTSGTDDVGAIGEGEHSAHRDPVAVTEEPKAKGLTQRHADELALQKTELVALHVASDPHFALTLGTFIIADKATQRYGYRYDNSLPSTLSANRPETRLSDFKSGSQASEAWTELDERLDQSWVEHKTPIERFDAFRALDDEARAAWLGWGIARTLTPVPHGEAGSDFTNHVGRLLDIDVASWWRPTAINYFDRVPKQRTLDALHDVGGSELAQRYAASKKGDLAATAEKLFAGASLAEAGVKQKALAWVPAEMAFEAATPDTDIDAQAQVDDESGDGSDIVDDAEDEESGTLSHAA